MRGVADAGVEVFDAEGVVGGVGVDGEEVAGAGDEGFFIVGEGWEDVAQGVFEHLGVVAVVPLWICQRAKLCCEVVLKLHLRHRD